MEGLVVPQNEGLVEEGLVPEEEGVVEEGLVPEEDGLVEEEVLVPEVDGPEAENRNRWLHRNRRQ